MQDKNFEEIAAAALQSVCMDLGRLNSIESFEEKFAFMWNIDEMRKMLSVKLVKSKKSEDEANQMRLEGNSFYKKKNYVKALEFYNHSIMHSPHSVLQSQKRCTSFDNSSYEYPKIDPAQYGGTVNRNNDTLAKGYANRSAIMYEIGCYDKCLSDIDLALESGYPENSCEKLNSRKEKCYKAIKENSSPKEDVCAIISRLRQNMNGNSEFSDSFVQQHGFKSESLYSKLYSKDHLLKDLLSIKQGYIPSVEEYNSTHPALSDCVRVAYTPTKGRGLVASKDLKPGDILGVERSPFSALNWGCIDSYCSSCLQVCLVPIPCPSCCKVVYCNEECRDKSLSEDHWLECSILPTLIAYEMDDIIALRMLKCLRFSQLKDMSWKLGINRDEDLSPEKAGCSSKGIYSSTSYQTMHHLTCTNKPYFPKLIFNLQLAVAFTSFLLECGRFFLDDGQEMIIPSQEDIILTGGILYSLIDKASVNEFKIFDLVVSNH